MIHVIASIRVREGQLAAFLEAFTPRVSAVRQETGCLEYQAAVDLQTQLPVQQLDERVITIIEKWESVTDLLVHLASPQMLAYREQVRDLVEDVSLKVLQQA